MERHRLFKVCLVSTIVVLILLINRLWRNNGSNYSQPPRAVLLASPRCPLKAENILAIYTGRWKFLRILLAHVYRELRSNGGVLDQVWFMIMSCDDNTKKKLKLFVQAANELQGKEIFLVHDCERTYSSAYYIFFNHLTRYPYDRFFKFDDDIVYIRPGAFNLVLEKKDPSRCFIHLMNTAGSSWRSNTIHQKLGVFDETNKNHPLGYCGWNSIECWELSLKTFLHHYHHSSLHKYYFKKDLEILSDRKRFSMNAFLLDKDTIDIPTMLEVGKITGDSDIWWSETLTAKVAHPNCIVGEALVVHFAYSAIVKELLGLGLLDNFAKIIENNIKDYKMELTVTKALE